MTARTPGFIVRLVRVRPVVDASDCLSRLRVALREQAECEAHASIPYVSLREFRAGLTDRLIHPAWMELVDLLGSGPAHERLRSLVWDVLAERVPVVQCDCCKRRALVLEAEIDRDEVALCPACTAVEEQRLLQPASVVGRDLRDPFTERAVA